MEPQPSGKREPPPWLAKVGLADFDPRPRSVLAALSRPREEELFCDSFRQLGWRVWPGSMSQRVFIAGGKGPDLVLIDGGPVSMLLLKHFFVDPRMSVVVLADDEEAERLAYAEGADHVIVRPIDPDDPLGFSHL